MLIYTVKSIKVNQQLKLICNFHISISDCKKYSQLSLNRDPKMSSKTFQPFMTPIIWPILYAAVFIHSGFIYGMYLMLTMRIKFYTYVWCE